MKKKPCLGFENRASISCRNENVAPESEISKRTKQVKSRRHELKQDRAYRYVLNFRMDSIGKHLATPNNGLPCLKSVAVHVAFESHVLVSLWDSDTKRIMRGVHEQL